MRMSQQFFTISLLRDLEYRANLVSMMLSGLIWTGIPLIMFKSIYLHANQIAGWSWSGMLILMGTYTLIDAIMMFLLINNMNELQSDIMQGKLDFALTKPVDSQFYVSFRQTNNSQLFNVLPGLLMILYGLHQTGWSIHVLYVLGYLLFFFTGMVLYYSVWFIWTTLSFWLPNLQSRERLFLDTVLMARFPSEIYKGFMGFVFTTIVPVAFIANPAAKMLMGKLSMDTAIYVLLLSLVMLVLSRFIWKRGVRAYSGAGG
ncbi:ABC transporter permease [Paenibacillus sediminis]|nr:ABC-2 family transporter protein [Paenibacillus sediminis]